MEHSNAVLLPYKVSDEVAEEILIATHFALLDREFGTPLYRTATEESRASYLVLRVLVYELVVYPDPSLSSHTHAYLPFTTDWGSEDRLKLGEIVPCRA